MPEFVTRTAGSNVKFHIIAISAGYHADLHKH